MDTSSEQRDDVVSMPDEPSVRDALARLLASDDLKASPQLASFLRFIVEEQLAGRADTIKGYTIATEALGRDTSFDPQTDPIVRVEATRLRRALDRYYGGSGRDDPVEIVVPKGAYVPQFVSRRASSLPDSLPEPLAGAEPAAPGQPEDVSRFGRFRGFLRKQHPARILVPALAVALVAALVTSFLAGRLQGRKERASAPTQTATIPAVVPQAAEPVLDLPVVRIEPFLEIGSPLDGVASARGINLRLRDALARFDEIVVLTSPAPALATAAPERTAVTDFRPPSQGASGPPGSYVVTGWIEGLKDGRFTLSVSLASAADGRVVWSRQFDAIKPDTEPGKTETALVREIATTIAQPYGVLLNDLRNRYTRPGPPRTRFGCLLAAYEYWQSLRPRDHVVARDCLEATAAAQPPSALVYANLASMELESYRLGLNARTGAPPLARGFMAAQQAVKLKPQSARSQDALMGALFARNMFDAGLEAGEAAMRANPYDSNIVANLGARKIANGDVDAGLALIDEATHYSTAPPPWYEFALFVGALMKNDRDGAHRHALDMRPITYFLSVLARTIDAAEGGEAKQAEALSKRLIDIQPLFGRNPRAALERLGASPPVLDRLQQGLTKAGLVTTANSAD
jgi:TolB-like protein